MNFCSDNTTGAAPEVMAALEAANVGPAMPYGADDLTARVEGRFQEVFETDAAIFMVGTGTAANSLCLSVMAPPYGAVFCHPESHIMNDECGAPEFFTGGAKLMPLPDHGGKITAADLSEAIDQPDHGVHAVQAACVSLTQSSEAGTLYSLDEIRAIADVAHGHGLTVHMDGARFANAIVGRGCTPAETTWKAGVDVLSFGATKNGAWAAEAIVAFDPGLADSLGFRRKRGGHLFSKMRFVAAQLDGYLAGGAWLRLAAHANAMAARLADGLAGVPGASFRHPIEANELFVALPEAVIQGLEADGFTFYRWIGETATLLRLVTSFATRQEDIDAFIASARSHAMAA